MHADASTASGQALTLKIADLVDANRMYVTAAFTLGLLALSVHPPRFFDLAPTGLVVATVLLLLRGRARASGIVMALAVLTKVFPLVLVPVAGIWLVATHGHRAAMRAGAAFGLVLLAGIALAVAVSATGVVDMIEFHLDRPA